MFKQLLFSSALAAAITLQSNTARPVVYMNRAETVMHLVLARTPDVPVVRNTGQFSDVPKGSWFEPYMLYAEKMGIIRPNELARLRPEASVTRAEFLKMLTSTFGLPIGYPHTFTDVPQDVWFAPYAGLAQHYRLFTLENASTLEPQRILTQEEALRAFRVIERMNARPQATPTLEQDLAQQQAARQLQIYTVISTRKQHVTLTEQPDRTPLVRRIAISVDLPDLHTQIVGMVNDIRLEAQLKPLTYNAHLEQSAQAFADRMAAEGFFSHTAPDGEVLRDRIARTTFYDRSYSVDCFCVKGYALGENIARGQKTAKEVMDAWMKSPAHRGAILNPAYTDLGVGVKSGVWVQHFGGVLLPG